MSKKLFIWLVVLMSLSLVGIILVQAFFINNSYQNEDKQFELNVTRSLSYVSRTIEDKEFQHYARKIDELKRIGIEADTTAITNLLIGTVDEINDETIIYQSTISEESFKIPSTFFEIGADSIEISRLSSKRETKVYSNNTLDGNLNLSPLRTYTEFSNLKEVEKKLFEMHYRDRFKNFPIYKRINSDNVSYLLHKYLKDSGIHIDFEFAIYDEDLATKVQSDNFEKRETVSYGVPIFLDNENESDYKLLVNFPDRRKFLISTISWMIFSSILFTSIIIFAFWSAIYQIMKQRKISQIKTDFINNMTHEFKTPIATINLALDSIKNPKIIGDQEKVLRYLKMIKEENKRMHAQVENVLRISKLDKNELNISKESLKLHDIVEDAITHVQLIVEDRQGTIKMNLNAAKSSVLVNETHMTNVIVNILDNAIKYSDEAPEIEVFTENVDNSILLKIKDKGNGMSKQVQKRVFEKFYREHTGNVHNVKGHGLGLAYVKKIIDDHQGYITVESEKGKGSIFTIKLPLIS